MAKAGRREGDLRQGQELPDDVAEIRTQMASPMQRDRYRHIVELVRLFNVHDALPTKGPIRYLVATGELEGRPYDISALSIAIGAPRTTIFRHLDEMKKEGDVWTERNGRRTIVYLTHDGWRHLSRKWKAFDPLINKFVSNQMKYLRLNGKNTE